MAGNDHSRVLVTGARGMLGTDLCAVLKEIGLTVVPADIAEFDLTDAAAARAFVRDSSPSVIINCAAYTAVDQAESEPELAFRVNRDGAKNIAEAAAQVSAALLHLSTDYVFDGAKAGPYVEDDPPNPLGVYGASKLAGEVAVQEALAEHYICRTAWLYGIHGKSFPRTMLSLAEKGKPLRVIHDQVGCPTYAEHLARALAVIIGRPLYGVYHVVNSGSCTWYELACEVFRAAGVSASVTPIATEEYPVPAPRPANSALDTSRLARAYGYVLPDWRRGVAEFVARWEQEESTG